MKRFFFASLLAMVSHAPLGAMATMNSASDPEVGTQLIEVKVEVTDTGFVPTSIEVSAGTDVTLFVTRRTEATCAKMIQVPSAGIAKTALPLNSPVKLSLGKVAKGEIKFGCGMDMMESGVIVVR